MRKFSCFLLNFCHLWNKQSDNHGLTIGQPEVNDLSLVLLLADHERWLTVLFGSSNKRASI